MFSWLWKPSTVTLKNGITSALLRIHEIQLKTLDQVDKTKPGISGYKISNHTIVLFDSVNFPGCKITRIPNQELVVEQSEIPQISNGVYEFCGPYKPDCPATLPLAADINKGALIYDNGQLRKILMSTFSSKDQENLELLINFHLIAHEGFHYFISSNIFGSTYTTYPNSVRSDTRSVMDKQCYNLTEEITALSKLELANLHRAFIAARKNEFDTQATHMKEFIRAREQRYKLTSNVKIKDDEILDCRTAEARMELGEGLADFSSTWAALEVFGDSPINRYYELSHSMGNSLFYPLGSLQLLNLILSGERSETVFKNILNSENAQDALYNRVKARFSSALAH